MPFGVFIMNRRYGNENIYMMKNSGRLLDVLGIACVCTVARCSGDALCLLASHVYL